jgi:hypothetical protein
MSIINRITTWTLNQILTSSALNGEFNNITNTLNNLDSATTPWDNVKTANLTVTGSLTLPTQYNITNWASYTPTIAGCGTVSNVGFIWKQIGDTVYVSGHFKAGTVAGTTASVTLPNSLTINYSVMSTFQDMIGTWASSHSETIYPNGDAGPMVTDGATTTTVFFAQSGSSGLAFPSAAGNGIAHTGDFVLMNFWFIH